jgi:hypothetical protein
MEQLEGSQYKQSAPNRRSLGTTLIPKTHQTAWVSTSNVLDRSNTDEIGDDDVVRGKPGNDVESAQRRKK